MKVKDLIPLIQYDILLITEGRRILFDRLQSREDAILRYGDRDVLSILPYDESTTAIVI